MHREIPFWSTQTAIPDWLQDLQDLRVSFHRSDQSRTRLLVLNQANPTGFIRFIPVDQGLCTTFKLTQNSRNGSAKTREPPARGPVGSLVGVPTDFGGVKFLWCRGLPNRVAIDRCH